MLCSQGLTGQVPALNRVNAAAWQEVWIKKGQSPSVLPTTEDRLSAGRDNGCHVGREPNRGYHSRGIEDAQSLKDVGPKPGDAF